jgi:hypothetical protein
VFRGEFANSLHRHQDINIIEKIPFLMVLDPSLSTLVIHKDSKQRGMKMGFIGFYSLLHVPESCRLRIPADLKGLVGKNEFRYSLRSGIIKQGLPSKVPFEDTGKLSMVRIARSGICQLERFVIRFYVLLKRKFSLRRYTFSKI